MTTSPRTGAQFEGGHFPVDPLAPDERRFLLRAVDALYAQGLTDDDEHAIYEHLVDQLRWVDVHGTTYCVDERWVMDTRTGETIERAATHG